LLSLDPPHTGTRRHRHHPSFPTRRSSDLGTVDVAVVPVGAPRAADHELFIVHRPAVEVRDLERVVRVGEVDDVDPALVPALDHEDRKSTRLNSSHVKISYAVFCLKKKKQE